jgi:omega-hydroxy-beta-dihydromenaquinone-9 sulfotransferase
MLFNFKLLYRVTYRSIFHTRGTHARLTPKRVCALLIIAGLYFFAEITSWIGFLLDEIFFSGYSRVQVLRPVFVIGPPRSGTTFMQRVLALDEGRFSSMKAWEIMFAPSVTQKKFFVGLGKLDSLFGGMLYRVVRTIETRIFKGLSDIHPASMFEAEEDGMILMHIFSSATAFFVLPVYEELWPYFFFDQKLDSAHRARILGFYKRCVQNHLYVFGTDKIFISKNPMFSTMVQSLDEVFPDAKFIHMVRTPFETVPSTISLISYYFNTLMNPLEPYPYLSEQLDMLELYYSYPQIKFAELPESRQQTIIYDDFIEKPEQTITQLYARFGIELSTAFAQALHNEQEKARRYKSRHAYSLEKFGLTPEDIVKKYEFVFERFGFERQPSPEQT